MKLSCLYSRKDRELKKWCSLLSAFKSGSAALPLLYSGATFTVAIVVVPLLFIGFFGATATFEHRQFIFWVSIIVLELKVSFDY